MKKQLSPGRIGGLVTVLISVLGVMLVRFHSVFLDVFCVCVALAALAISVRVQCRPAGSRR